MSTSRSTQDPTTSPDRRGGDRSAGDTPRGRSRGGEWSYAGRSHGERSRAGRPRDGRAHGQRGRGGFPRGRDRRSGTTRGTDSGPQLTLERQLDAALDAAALVEPADLPATFADTELPERLVEALGRRGMHVPFPIQARTLPDALAGRDVLGRAQTGSGKTLAFGLPMLARLAATPGTSGPGHPHGLVLVPTRELAQQVADALAPLGRRVGLALTTIYGGASMQRQVLALRGGVDVVVATPGRLIDLIEQGECSLGDIAICVLDEADYMADLGFLPAVTRILDLTPAGAQRMLFSATLDHGVSLLVERYLTDPAFHAVAPAAAPVESVEHQVFTLHPDDKVAVAAEIAARPGRTMFFVRTKHGADRLVKQLRQAGVEAAAIHGNLKQGARRRALAGFAAGSPRVLVATDVAARGIHVDDVDLVVHFDPSADPKDYLHRSGRTARAGATGTVVSLVCPDQRHEVERLHRRANVTATAVDVEPGHTAVRAVATSGTPVVVRTPAPLDASRKRLHGRGAGGQGDTGGRGGVGGRGAGAGRGGAGRGGAGRVTGRGAGGRGGYGRHDGRYQEGWRPRKAGSRRQQAS